jgi:hypothetical protein
VLKFPALITFWQKRLQINFQVSWQPFVIQFRASLLLKSFFNRVDIVAAHSRNFASQEQLSLRCWVGKGWGGLFWNIFDIQKAEGSTGIYN